MATEKTTNLDLNKQAGVDYPDVALDNENWDTLDEEVAARAKSWNGIEPDESGDIKAYEIDYANNFLSDSVQNSEESYIARSSGGSASISDGDAWLIRLTGRRVHNGYVAEVLEMTVDPMEREAEEGETPETITATLDKDVFRAYVASSGTIDLYYTSAWSTDPTLYGITVTGTPISGDHIQVVYVKEDRGTIVQSNPTRFVSTGWNLYNHTNGYARVVKYSETYNFKISGTYTSLAYSETLAGEQTAISVVDGNFTIPGDGYVWVTGGNNTSTAIWMTWSDWTDEANGGTFAAYSETEIDLSSLMSARFPYGLMQVGAVCDVIDINAQQAISRIERLAYSAANLAAVIAADREYECDTNYIYAVKSTSDSYSISVDGAYTASDHGMEIVDGTSVGVFCETMYGNNLKNKLERDVVTISQQTLSSSEKTQVRTNIGAASASDLTSLSDHITMSSSLGTVTSSGLRYPASGTDSRIKSTHRVVNSVLGTPSVQTSDWTVETYDGYLLVKGSASGATSIDLDLMNVV